MKIVHITPAAPYNDNWGYQDNLLPRYHAKLGHDVSIITTNLIHKDGGIIAIDCGDYVLQDGVHVYRFARHVYKNKVLTSISHKIDIYPLLKELEPDFVFFHGLSSTTIIDVIKYKKKANKPCVIVQDNHVDYNIAYAAKSALRNKMIRLFYRCLNHYSIKYVDKVYGVTPWRKMYAEDIFGIPSSKTDVLIMGADDEKLRFDKREEIRTAIRNQYGVRTDEFLIVTGGKIDSRKKIDILMEACAEIKGVKLLVFGNVQSNIEEKFNALLKANNNIIFVGWIDSDKVYDYFFAADLVFFPGQHSVLWEQACASKVPCVFEKWEGMDHVNNGGNSCFLTPVNKETIVEIIDELKFTETYQEMLAAAMSEKTEVYLYSNIARKSLECMNV